MHSAYQQVGPIILAQDPPAPITVGNTGLQDAWVYTQDNTSVIFISNNDTANYATVTVQGTQYV
jgi:hypothetical protein